MIGFLRGKVHAFGLDYVLLDVRDVGYRVAFFHPDKLRLNEEVLIYTYQNVREDELSLFGFLSLSEYDLFTKLISVKGLGPKIASGVLSVSTPERIIEAIENGDAAYMKSLPGIGSKTASQIILDLKGKLVSADNNNSGGDEGKYADVAEALKQLGYKPAEYRGILKSLASEELSVQACLKRALALLNRK